MTKDCEAMNKHAFQGKALKTLRASRQQGASLIMVMLVLIIVSVLGVGAAQIALMSERGARNDRDMLMAAQSAEAALIDAEQDMFHPTATTPDTASTRKALFDGKSVAGFTPGCGTAASDNTKGLCTLAITGTPAWLGVDFTNTAANAPTTELGTFTGRAFAAGTGVEPAQKPRYVIELVPDPGRPDLTKLQYAYRVTAMGFGPRTDIQAVTQMFYKN